MNSPSLSWIHYNSCGYRASHKSSTNVAISSAYLLFIAAISGQLEPSSIIVKAQICTVFVCCCTPSSDFSNSYFIFHGPHKSTESSSQGLIILSSRSGSLPSLTTFVFCISLHVLHVAVISLQRMNRSGHVKFARTLSSNLLTPGCYRVSCYHSSKTSRSVVGR